MFKPIYAVVLIDRQGVEHVRSPLYTTKEAAQRLIDRMWSERSIDLGLLGIDSIIVRTLGLDEEEQ